MKKVTYIVGKDHGININMPGGTPFPVTFKKGVGGHSPPGKSGWVEGIPDDVAAAWQANGQPAHGGYIIEDTPAPAAAKPAAKKPAAVKKPAAKKPAAKK